MSTATRAAAYIRTFPGHPGQLSAVRRDITHYLTGCPAASDAVLIASELAANAILRSRSRGRSFTLRVDWHYNHCQIQCHDAGGPWQSPRHEDRPHGLDIIQALTGPHAWGTRTASDSSRIVWATLTW